MKYIGFLTTTREDNGIVLTENEFDELETAYRSANIIDWRGKKVIVKDFNLELTGKPPVVAYIDLIEVGKNDR